MQTILPNTVLTKLFTRAPSQPKVRRTELSRRKLLTESFRKVGKIICVRGTLWVTRDGQQTDILLREGDRLTCEPQSSFVIEALENAVVEVIR